VEGDPTARVAETILLRDLLRTLVEDCAIEAEAKGCRLEFEETRPFAMRGDTELLRRAFENVIRNAIRYTAEETRIEICLAQCSKGTKVVVRDFGPGVPDEALPFLFDPFFRVEDDRGRESGGVGLGLAIARRSVAIHGGSIAAQNAKPGLAVEIVLPGS
jgi:two-component system sensor histidine kinase CpxA